MKSTIQNVVEIVLFFCFVTSSVYGLSIVAIHSDVNEAMVYFAAGLLFLTFYQNLVIERLKLKINKAENGQFSRD